MTRKTLPNFTVPLIALALLCMITACSSDSDDSGGSPSAETTIYHGVFTIASTSYTKLSIVSDGTYTITGNGTADSGTYTAAKVAISAGTYTFTSTTHDGTFTVKVSGNELLLAGGTIEASGEAVNIVNNTYTVTEGYWNGVPMPDGSTESFIVNADGTFTLVGTGYGLSAKGTYEIDATEKTITFTYTEGDIDGIMIGIYTNTGEFIRFSGTVTAGGHTDSRLQGDFIRQ